MAKPWAEVAKSDGYRALSSAEREEARNEYWREVVAPRLPVAELMGVRQAFDADTAPGLLAQCIGRPACGLICDKMRQNQTDFVTPAHEPHPIAAIQRRDARPALQQPRLGA